MNYKYSFYISLTLFIVFSCTNKDDGEGAKGNFDRKAMLTHLGTNLIVPAYSDFKTSAQVLLDKVNGFAASTNETTLADLQTSWKDAAKKWSACGPYNYLGPTFDPAAIININNFPVDAAKIESALAGTQDTDPSSLGSRGVGLPAIEYLIFNKNGNSSVIASFTNEAAAKRKLYLKKVAESLLGQATSLYVAWDPAQGNYLEQFINNTGTDAGSSTNLLANSIIQGVELFKNKKIGIPLGKKEAGGIKPESVEAYYSGYSVELIQADLKAVEDAFVGNSKTGTGLSFDDYLNSVGSKWEGTQLLSERINQQFSNINTTLTDINMPLSQAVSSDPAKVDKAFNASTSLISLLKGKMISDLGLTVEYTDNDGD